MTSKNIKKLAKKTYSAKNLNRSTLNRITSLLGKRKLSIYIKELRNIEKRKIVKVYVPSREILTHKLEHSLKRFFQNKEIHIIEDPSVFAGIRIIDDDMVYEFNLRDSLTSMIDHIQKTYD